MRYIAYSNYQEETTPELGALPCHWEHLPIKFCLSIPIADGPHETPEILDEGIPFISAEAVKDGQLDFSKKRGFISIEDHKRFSKKYKPKRGDVYMVKSGATTGNVARVQTDEEFNIWSPLAAMRPDTTKATTDFIYYFMLSKPFRHSVELAWSYGTQQNIGMGVVSNLEMACPSPTEQEQIAAFLDWKTGQIDALIARKKELLEKLNEKRIAVITQAVTQGLDPAAAMRDSGNPWLGQVPKHWEVKRLRFLLCERFTNGLFKKAEYWGDGYRIVNVTDLYVHNDLVDETLLERLECDDCEVQNYAAQHGDFFVVRSSLKLEGIGKSAALLNPSEPTVFECHIVRGRPKLDEVHPRFLNLFMNSTYARQYFMTSANVVTMATIDQENIKNLIVALPEYHEQEQIAEYLDKYLARIDAMVAATEKAMERLEEYRTALITAATTGKIDVRNVKVPAQT